MTIEQLKKGNEIQQKLNVLRGKKEQYSEAISEIELIVSRRVKPLGDMHFSMQKSDNNENITLSVDREVMLNFLDVRLQKIEEQIETYKALFLEL